MTSSTVQTAAPRAASDGISEWEESPLLHMTRLCLSFLQGLFAEAPSGHFHWVEDKERTEILITDESPLNAEVVNKRPAIVSVRAPIAFAGVSLEQMHTTSIKTGMRLHSDLISGHMTFNCLSSKKVEAEQIAWLVARHCWILHRIMLRAGFHKFGERIQILAASPAGAIISGDTTSEIITVPVVVPLYFQWQETVTPQNLYVLNKVEANMTVNMRSVRGDHDAPATAVSGVRVRTPRGRVRPAHIKGRPIETAATQSSSQPADPPMSVNILVEAEGE